MENMPGIFRTRFATLCLAIAFSVFFKATDIFCDDLQEKLLLKDGTGRIILERPVQNGTRFCIRYTHSVALSPVEDHFVIRNSAMFLDRTVYHDFGAGLPHQPEDGQKMTSCNGRIVISGYERKLDSFDLRVGRIAGHTLIFSGDCGSEAAAEAGIPLNVLARPGSAITFELTPPRNI